MIQVIGQRLTVVWLFECKLWGKLWISLLKKVPGLEIKVPKGNAFAFETDPMMFKSHQSCLVIGKRGSGKSVIAVNIIERMKYDRIFIVSPTIQSNKALLDRLRIDPDDIYDPDD